MSHPLQASLARVGARTPEPYLHFGLPSGEAGWTTCREVIDDPAILRRWQDDTATYLRTESPDVPLITPAAYVLGDYAAICGRLGGAVFGVDRRVPRLDPDALAFRQHPEECWPHAVALLDPRFWCLPGDPDADHPAAAVVADEAALAAILRAQVRAHAEAFLATYEPGVRLPRRHLLGVFFDGLDCGPWSVADSPQAALADGAHVLPGRTVEFTGSSTLYQIVDARGREHLTRERVSCCYAYKLAEGTPCFTCPRTSLAERAERAATWPDEERLVPAG